VSGGKDSAALCLHLRERGIPYRAVHMDTKWEHPDTDAYIREVLDPAIGPIEWITPPLGFADLCRKKGFFPSRLTRFCTQQLKLFPFFKWIEANYGTQQISNAIGIRSGESEARSRLGEFETTSYGEIWRPLIDWSEQDVIDIHKRHGLPPNPLYLRGAARVGCWPCIFSRKSEIKFLAKTDPERIAEIEFLESELQMRMMERGPCAHLPSFFQPRDEQTYPIRKVVEWARTSRGGKQIELFDDQDARSGCLRWGTCEV